jgi:uncharacterized membrane protein
MHTQNTISFVMLGLYLTGTPLFLVTALLTDTLTFSLKLFAAGLFVGAGSFLGNFCYVRAMRLGPVSLTGPLANSNIVLVILMSVLFYGEAVGAKDVVGVILLLVAVSVIAIDPNESLSIKSRWWYVLVAVSIVLFFMRNGGLKITQEANLENTPVLFYGYGIGIFYFAVMLSAGQWLRQNASFAVTANPRFPIVQGAKKAFQIGLLNGICSFGGIQLYAYALTVGPASLISPIFAANGLVAALLSIVYFRERLSKLQVGALVGIMVALVLLAS